MRNIFKLKTFKFAANILGAAMVFGLQELGRPQAAPAFNNPLPVEIKGQETDKWCWAASAEMIMAYRDKKFDETQCHQAEDAFGTPPLCCGKQPVPDNFIKAAWPNFAHYKFKEKHIDGALDPDQIRNEIKNDRPFCFTWDWSGAAGAHMMVGIGYQDKGGVFSVIAIDPRPVFRGTKLVIPYEFYKSKKSSSNDPLESNGYTHGVDFYQIEPSN